MGNYAKQKTEKKSSVWWNKCFDSKMGLVDSKGAEIHLVAQGDIR
jgi:hypothetical protein